MSKNLSKEEEKFCQNIAIKQLSQYASYLDAYLNNEKDKWKRSIVDSRACDKMKKQKIMVRIKQLKDKIDNKMTDKIVYNREIAYNNFQEYLDILKKELKVALDSIELTEKDRAYIVNALSKTIKDMEENKSKLFGLFVDKKDIKVSIKPIILNDIPKNNELKEVKQPEVELNDKKE